MFSPWNSWKIVHLVLNNNHSLTHNIYISTFYFLDEIGLHRIENLSHTDYAVSLHLYSPPFDECKCFDQNTGHVTNAKVTFWSKFGKLTPFVSIQYLVFLLKKLLQWNLSKPNPIWINICVRNKQVFSCAFEPCSCEVYSTHHYVIKFVSDLQQVSGFLRVLLFPQPIYLTTTI
jgi:hypothetical protein